MINDINTTRSIVERQGAELFVHTQIMSALQKMGAPIDIARRGADHGAEHYSRSRNVADALKEAVNFTSRIHAGFKGKK